VSIRVNQWRDDLVVFLPQEAALAGVRVEAADGHARLGDARRAQRLKRDVEQPGLRLRGVY
jgi:hypothetical protein